jgi:hypothetical protein
MRLLIESLTYRRPAESIATPRETGKRRRTAKIEHVVREIDLPKFPIRSRIAGASGCTGMDRAQKRQHQPNRYCAGENPYEELTIAGRTAARRTKIHFRDSS